MQVQDVIRTRGGRVFCVKYGFTNHFCYEYWRHVCVLDKDMYAFEYVSVLTSVC